MFTEPVVRAYAAPQGGAMFIEPWSVGTRHPSGVQCYRARGPCVRGTPAGCNVYRAVVRTYAAPQRGAMCRGSSLALRCTSDHIAPRWGATLETTRIYEHATPGGVVPRRRFGVATSRAVAYYKPAD